LIGAVSIDRAEKVHPGTSFQMMAIPKPKRKRTWRKPTKYDPPRDPAATEEHEEEAKIEEGINDLMNLKPAVIQDALIERGYHPGIIRTLDHNYCVFLLRESEGHTRGPQRKGKAFTTLRSSKCRRTKNPLFTSRNEGTTPEDD
jgi:hypothetical protein